MHYVIGLWTMDPAQQGRQERELRERIVPTVRNARGFVRLQEATP